jgi:ABC-2 type transport system permease protein
MRPIPGSSLWLLRYELLQHFRQSQRVNKKFAIIVVGFLLTVMVVTGIPLALTMRHLSFAASPPLILVLDGISVLVLSIMLSQSLLMAVSTFYERADHDLLLSSPLRPARIFRIRWIGIFLSVAAAFLMLATPWVIPVAILDRWQIVGVYSVIVGLALTATATGLILASILIQLFGPRRTRAIAAVLASFIGLTVFLAIQVINVFRSQLHPEIKSAVIWLRSANARAILGPDLPWSWPARAALGEVSSVMAILGISVIYYIAAVQFVGGRFSAQAASIIGVDARNGRSSMAALRRFRGGINLVLIQKELYPYDLRTRKSAGLMIRKLSETESQ